MTPTYPPPPIVFTALGVAETNVCASVLVGVVPNSTFTLNVSVVTSEMYR